MLGWFVTSGYFQNESVLYVKDCFKNAFKKHGIDFCHVKSNEKICCINESGNIVLQGEKPDFVVFWDKDVLFANMLEQLGIKVFNNSKSIEICDDKAKTVVALAGHGIAMPKTVVAPLVFANCDEKDETFINNLVQTLDFPMIVKESSGSFGWQVYLCETEESAKKLIEKLGAKPFLMQEFICESKGRDLRVNVVGDKAVCAMERVNENDFRSNVTGGGKARAHTLSKEESELAVAACKAVGADFAGVDLLFGKDGMLVCEVNSNPHFKSTLDCTGVDLSLEMMRYIKAKVQGK